MAGSSVTITFEKITIPFFRPQDIPGLVKVLIDWTADASDGSVPDTAFSSVAAAILGRYCCLAVTDPGATAPTDDYDITIEDEYGADVFGGSLLNRDTANSEQAIPTVGDALASRLCGGDWTFKLSGNSVNSATGKLALYFEI